MVALNKNLEGNKTLKVTDYFWGERWVSNPRPTVPQTVALTY